MFPKPDKPVEDVKPEVPGTPITPAACNKLYGTMPSCAPLSVPYVPFQQKGSPKYEVAEALDNGTLFPGLNLPFFRKADATQVPATPLAELQALEFVLTELGLYLDSYASSKVICICFWCRIPTITLDFVYSSLWQFAEE